MITTQLYISSILIVFFSICAAYSTWHKANKETYGTGFWLIGYIFYFISIGINLLNNIISDLQIQILTNSFECAGSYLQLFGFMGLFANRKCTKKFLFVFIAFTINLIGIYFQIVNKTYLYRFGEILNNLIPALFILFLSVMHHKSKYFFSKYVIIVFIFISLFFLFESVLYLTGFLPSVFFTLGSYGPLSWVIIIAILVFSQNQIINKFLSLKVYENLQQTIKYKESLITVNNELLQANKDIIMILVDALETRISEASDHVLRVSELTKIILNAMQYSEGDKDQIINAAALHDIGKIGISDLLLCSNRKYTNEEKKEMEKHAIIGYEILIKSESSLLKTAALISLEHHENWDGSGYPLAKKETEISVASRVVAIADVFDALTHSRSYKKEWTFSDSMQYVFDNSEIKFDPEIVKVLPSCIDELRKIVEETKH